MKLEKDIFFTPSNTVICKITDELYFLIHFLNELDIRFAIMHACEDRGILSFSDIDIYIEEAKMNLVIDYLKSNYWTHDLSYTNVKKRFFFSKIISGWRIKLDLTSKIGVFAKDYFYPYLLHLGTKTAKDRCRYLDDPTAYWLILKKMLVTNELSEHKLNEARALARRCGLLPHFDDTYQTKIAENIRELTQPVFGEKIKLKFSFFYFCLCHLRKLRFSSAPVVISFVGVDGAGKSTYINLLAKVFTARNIKTKVCYLGHSRYELKFMQTITTLKKSNSQWLRRLGSILYLIFLPVELLYRRGLGRYNVILTDRHPFFELILNSKIGELYSLFVSILCPRVNYVFYLSGNNRILWQRKQEHAYEVQVEMANNIDKRIKRLNELLPSIAICEFDSTDSIESNLTHMIEQIERMLNAN